MPCPRNQSGSEYAKVPPAPTTWKLPGAALTWLWLGMEHQYGQTSWEGPAGRLTPPNQLCFLLCWLHKEPVALTPGFIHQPNEEEYFIKL